MLSTGILSAIATLGLLGWLRSRAPSPGRCRRCGYDLGGLRTLQCPECGSALPPAQGPVIGARRTLFACLAVSIGWLCTVTTLMLQGQSTLVGLLSRLDFVPVGSVATTWTFRPSVAGLGRPRAGQPLYLVQLRFEGRLNGANAPVSGVSSVTLMHEERSITFAHAIRSEVFSISRTDLLTWSRAGDAQVPGAVHPLAAMDASFVRAQLTQLGASLPMGPEHTEADQEVHLLADLITSHLTSPTLPGRLSHSSNPDVQFTFDIDNLPSIMFDAAPEFETFRRGTNAALVLSGMGILLLMWRWIWTTLRPRAKRAEISSTLAPANTVSPEAAA